MKTLGFTIILIRDLTRTGITTESPGGISSMNLRLSGSAAAQRTTIPSLIEELRLSVAPPARMQQESGSRAEILGSRLASAASRFGSEDAQNRF